MYLSPIPFTGITDWQLEPAQMRSALLLAKRKLMAEFELTEASTIFVSETELNRQEVVTLFDELLDARKFSWHLAIYQDQDLLQFLQTGVVATNASWNKNELYDAPAFLQFVSPFYAEACNVLMQQMLQHKQPISALNLIQDNKVLLLAPDGENAFRYVTRFFLEKKNELFQFQQRIESNQQLHTNELQQWRTDEQLFVLNHLPGNFNIIRYQLANTLNNICVQYDKKNAPKHALIAIQLASGIRTEDEELKVLIPKNLQIIRSKQKHTLYNIDAKTGKKKPKLGVIIAIIIVLIHFVSVFTEDDHQVNYNDTAYQQSNSGNSLSMPSEYLMSVYTNLLAGLQQPVYKTDEADTGRKIYQIAEPKQNGDTTFNPVFNGEFASAANHAFGAQPGIKTKRLRICNKSHWHLLAFYVYDGHEFYGNYVAPNDSGDIFYTANNIRLDLLAGKKWRSDARFIFDIHQEKFALSGGYTVFPHNQRSYLPSSNKPVFERDNVLNEDLQDVIIVTDSAGQNIYFSQKNEPVNTPQ